MINSWLAFITCIRSNVRYKMQNTRKVFGLAEVSGGLSCLFHLLVRWDPSDLKKTKWNN